jgi:RHS repeat-associated protein
VADNSGQLKEWYRYDLWGLPVFLSPSNTVLSASNYPSVKHLFTGQQWYSDVKLYNLRNRFYSPDMGRFLQPDPIGFEGDATNLYRYCGNNSLNLTDPLGLFHWGQFGGGLSLMIGGGFGMFAAAGTEVTTLGLGTIPAAGLAIVSAGAASKGFAMVMESVFSNTTDSQKLPNDVISGAGRMLPGNGPAYVETGMDIVGFGLAGLDAFQDTNQIGRVLDIFNSLAGVTMRLNDNGTAPTSPTGITPAPFENIHVTLTPPPLEEPTFSISIFRPGGGMGLLGAPFIPGINAPDPGLKFKVIIPDYDN